MNEVVKEVKKEEEINVSVETQEKVEETIPYVSAIELRGRVIESFNKK